MNMCKQMALMAIILAVTLSPLFAAERIICLEAEQFAERGGWSEIYLGINPSVSPDGSFFAFEWKDRVWLAPTEGGVATPIGDGMSADSRPFLSPDGKRLAFLSDRWGTLQLFEADLDEERLVASGARQVTFHTEGLYPWGYTPDGADMIALAYRDDASESASSKRLSRRPILVSMGGRRAERLVFDAPAFCPSFSPDGSKVLFSWRIEENGLEFRKRHSWSKSSGSGEIWLYDRDGRSFATTAPRRYGRLMEGRFTTSAMRTA